ncbi:uncharacterized protein LTR77_008761 [Saxophila tyrrhenica]|uniref:Uncharacterized protein n=1 Tax=Saxophila tyrrhenica TaxID=1690608 RepID=A0AAV9P320_9PEZI|nr:hypothetical protein LTR77_008761 [Saxophila tyrrhenica]
MASILSADEYNDIIHINRPVKTRPGQVFISADSPAQILQICREQTLAQGRILYEVHDTGSPIVVGYIVPNAVSQLAANHKDGVNLRSWDNYNFDQQRKLRRAHWQLRKQFPRLPAIAAKDIAQQVVSEGWTDDKQELEITVAKYALQEWTSFEFRLEALVVKLPALPDASTIGADEFDKAKAERDQEILRLAKQVFRQVKPRFREVLRSWLPVHTGHRELSALYRRRKVAATAAREETVGLRSLSMPAGIGLMHHGGMETIANIMLHADVFT